jgi:hypothetical protein
MLGSSSIRHLSSILSIALAVAQTIGPAPHSRPANGNDYANISFDYRFENPRFFIPWIEIKIEPDSKARLRFKRGESEEVIERDFEVLPRTQNRIIRLAQRLDLFNTNEEFQHKKNFSHLGWMTISVRQGRRTRSFRFNYTSNPHMTELADIFRALATQEINLTSIELAQQHQPLDLPRLLEGLENDLRLDRIAEPEKLLKILSNMSNDDVLPIIARNHANRLINGIKKGKFKSPAKSDK